MGFSENKLDSGWWIYTPELERSGPSSEKTLLLAFSIVEYSVSGIIPSLWFITERFRIEI